jgi:TPP-dependent trihydroxycyclohexane-1,2-dione (THcHDO) dehydratase
MINLLFSIPTKYVYSTLMSRVLFVYCKVIFFKVNLKKINSRKVNYFSMFGSLIKNKLENIFQCLVMSWKISWKITY